MSEKVLLLTMPWATPVHRSLALGLLSAILRDHGIESECLYGNLLLPRRAASSVYAIQDPGHYEDRSAGLAFAPYLYPQVTPAQIAEEVAERHLAIVGREGHLETSHWRLDVAGQATRDKLVEQTLEDIEGAGICLERCMQRIQAGSYDIVGMSLTFETQLIGSLALARRIRQFRPDMRIILGGAACTSNQGVAILKAFDTIDAVCLGEADAIVVPLIEGLRTKPSKLANIPGIAYRGMDGVFATRQPEPIRDLDWIPRPNYDPYVEQKAASEWTGSPTVLLFETSRGCWWGEKHLCSFCGLNAETLTYRSKSAQRVMQDIAGLCERYDTTDGLQAVDNIFDPRYFADLAPRLAAFQKQTPVTLFFEIKSNINLNQMYQLAASGFGTLQPGIEAFNDHILSLMDKGANTIQQINFIKWAHQLGISPTYNILMRNPGETAQDYRDMIALLPYIEHLPPPNGIANMQLERYSPYFLNPAKYGIRHVRPKHHYRLMFPDERVDIDELVYQFDFDHDELDAPDLVAARRDFLIATLNWKAAFKVHRLIYHRWNSKILILDRRGKSDHSEWLSGLAADVFLFLDQGHPFNVIRRRFPTVPEQVLQAFLDRMVAAKYVYRHMPKDTYVTVALRVYEDQEQCRKEMDAAVEQSQARRRNRAAVPHGLVALEPAFASAPAPGSCGS
ncbi:MAG: RiPP maturation radical SAM protein 1 [Bryobacteraceae bacterium]|nr:RiPP maturation radical SAM protein 1 [Bryobacteraceae bacterium]